MENDALWGEIEAEIMSLFICDIMDEMVLWVKYMSTKEESL